ncbi:MAG: carboxypeptidase-like regulatory domain-containing protein, partial [Flavobacterium sp.]|nr:carboxypeptidase-like regulatory domain-containing protein [Flavobacterium sp.]
MKIRLIILFFLIHSNLFSQKIISGYVKNNENSTLENINVILKNNEKIFNYTFTDSKGFYKLETNEEGVFIVSFSSISYKTLDKIITIKSEDSIIEINPKLEEGVYELNEVEIEIETEIRKKSDTIIFNADSFKQGNEQVVEDLLKKLPGLSINDDGTIFYGNQSIEKVMVDGDDMFDKGYKILTKNMPVNPIDKIQLLQNYSNNKHLKGIENSEKVALNLTLKEDYKRIWFGDIGLGYGLASENRYEVRNNLMNFGKKNKYYFLTNLNNIGEDAVGDLNDLIRPYRFNEPASIGDNQSANSLLSLGFNNPNLKKKRVNFNNAELLSLNSIFTLSEKIKLKILYFLNTDENDFFRNSFQSFTVGTATFSNIEDFVGRKKSNTSFGKIDLIYDISKTKTFEYSGKFNKTNIKSRSNLLFNSNLLNEQLDSNNQLFNQKIVFTNKFRENKVFLLSGCYINEKTPQNYSVNQFIFEDIFLENANNTKQFSENRMQYAGIEAHLLDKKENDDLLEVKMGNLLRIDDLDTSFDLLDNENSVDLPVGYQNQLNYLTNDLYLSIKYCFNFDKFTLTTQSD